jgi:hypothetical protein
MFTKLPGLHLYRLILEYQPSRPLQHDDPFVLILVAPKSIRRSVAERDDPFDAHVGGVKQGGEKLVRQVLGEVSEEISRDGHIPSIPSFLNQRASPISKAVIASASV